MLTPKLASPNITVSMTRRPFFTGVKLMMKPIPKNDFDQAVTGKKSQDAGGKL